MPTKYAIQITVNGGGEPNAWNIAHSTVMSKPHQATAPEQARVARAHQADRGAHAARGERRHRRGARDPAARAPDPAARAFRRRSMSPGSSATSPRDSEQQRAPQRSPARS